MLALRSACAAAADPEDQTCPGVSSPGNVSEGNAMQFHVSGGNITMHHAMRQQYVPTSPALVYALLLRVSTRVRLAARDSPIAAPRFLRVVKKEERARALPTPI